MQKPTNKPVNTQTPVPLDPNSTLGKKPRTVHIDVYCTGTEIESSSSCSDSENKTTSSPQTVFETGKFKLTHRRADVKDVPHQLKNIESSSTVSELSKKGKKDESEDEDGESTQYPSQISSFSTLKDLGSSVSSVPPSWSTYSMSSSIPRDDSIANTSWKDTYSDLGSLLESRSSIAQTESLDFVPRRVWQRSSIDECPELEKVATENSSKGSLQPSDSFEYANSEDRLRIKRMEQMWEKDKSWKSPSDQRKQILEKKIKEYVDRHLSSDKSTPKSESKDSESEGSDSDEKGWSFVKDNSKPDERVKQGINETKPDVKNIDNKCKNVKKKSPKIVVSKSDLYEDHGSLSDSSPTSKSPSGLILKERMNLNPDLRAPFTILPGVHTEQREVAERFGRIVGLFKKPGHHVGPAKNPDCTCQHCRAHFNILGVRGRTRSWTEPPPATLINWKELDRANREPIELTRNHTANLSYTDY